MLVKNDDRNWRSSGKHSHLGKQQFGDSFFSLSKSQLDTDRPQNAEVKLSLSIRCITTKKSIFSCKLHNFKLQIVNSFLIPNKQKLYFSIISCDYTPVGKYEIDI